MSDEIRNDQDTTARIQHPPLLDPSIAYVRGWRQANEATVNLRAVIDREFGDLSFPDLRADVDMSGRGRVDLGELTAERAVELLLALSEVVYYFVVERGSVPEPTADEQCEEHAR